MQDERKIAGQVLLIPQEEILPNKNQPRKRFENDSLEGLAQSIRQNGIIQPLIVRCLPTGQYELIAGERRLRAARIVGVSRVPCIVLKISEERSALYALLENIQRQNLDYFEEAEALVHLMLLYRLSQEELAQMLGKAPSTISNKLRLLRLPSPIRLKILEAGLSERHARALLQIQDAKQMENALEQIIEKRMNVAQTDKLIQSICSENIKPKKTPIKLFKDLRLFVNTINHAVETMQRAGIAANAIKSETSDYIEYTVRIPKQKPVSVGQNKEIARP